MATQTQSVQSERKAQLHRKVSLRTRGNRHGGLTRLASPGDVGELIKPFIFLDYFEADAAHAPHAP